MKQNPRVIAFMTPFPHSIDVTAPLEAARLIMREHNFRHLPVLSAGALVGVLTDRDIKLVLRPESEGSGEQDLKVGDAHVEEPCLVAASTPVAEVAKVMAEKRISCAIVTKYDKLVGIFTDGCVSSARRSSRRAQQRNRRHHRLTHSEPCGNGARLRLALDPRPARAGSKGLAAMYFAP